MSIGFAYVRWRGVWGATSADANTVSSAAATHRVTAGSDLRTATLESGMPRTHWSSRRSDRAVDWARAAGNVYRRRSRDGTREAARSGALPTHQGAAALSGQGAI